jgi:hypothetical protein
LSLALAGIIITPRMAARDECRMLERSEIARIHTDPSKHPLEPLKYL